MTQNDPKGNQKMTRNGRRLLTRLYNANAPVQFNTLQSEFNVDVSKVANWIHREIGHDVIERHTQNGVVVAYSLNDAAQIGQLLGIQQ